MKNFSIFIFILIFIVFFIYEKQKNNYFKVLNINSPSQIIIDLNNNGIEDENETIDLNDIKTFSLKNTQKQKDLAKSLKINEEDALGLGYLSDNFAKETLSEKQVIYLKNTNQIIVDNKDYKTLLLSKGFAITNKKVYSNAFKNNLIKIKKLNLVIYNNKSQKFHKLNCKYGLMAHNFQIIPANQLPDTAKPCKFCHGKNYKYFKKKFYGNYHPSCRFASKNNEIPDIKCPPTEFYGNDITLYLTNLTKVLKPNNSCTTQLCKALVKQINNTNETIDFAIYGYSNVPSIQQALLAAQKRGVKIRFVYDWDKKQNNFYPDTNILVSLFPENNHDSSSKIMHNKFFIFDNNTVLTGSANISTTDMSGYNSNAVIIIKSKAIAKMYNKEFNQMYLGNFHKQKKKIKEKYTSIGDSNLVLFFSPKDSGIEEIIPLIDAANKYVYIPAFLVTHQNLTQSLINAHKRGVDVKIILDATNTHAGSHSKMAQLRQSGIPVKTEIWAGKLHSKSILIDDTYTIIGSMNFSKSGEAENDENLLVIKNPEMTIFYKRFFLYLWKRTPERWLNHNARAESPDSIGSCNDRVDNDFDGKIDKQDDSCKIYTKKQTIKRKGINNKHLRTN